MVAADVEAVRRERDFYKQQMEYFRQQYNAQMSRMPSAAGVPSDGRPPMARVSILYICVRLRQVLLYHMYMCLHEARNSFICL